jgi:DNA mismatch repair protein MSH6
MAQLGMLVPAKRARCVCECKVDDGSLIDIPISLCPVDSILTRMGAYDNMFSNASTFKVELDEWSVSLSLQPHGPEQYCRQLQDPS